MVYSGCHAQGLRTLLGLTWQNVATNDVHVGISVPAGMLVVETQSVEK